MRMFLILMVGILVCGVTIYNTSVIGTHLKTNKSMNEKFVTALHDGINDDHFKEEFEVFFLDKVETFSLSEPEIGLIYTKRDVVDFFNNLLYKTVCTKFKISFTKQNDKKWYKLEYTFEDNGKLIVLEYHFVEENGMVSTLYSP